MIKQVQKDFPELPIRLVIARPDTPNRKISLLSHLAKEARYEILVASDSDMRVKPEYLKRVVQPLNDPRTGLVTCPYRGVHPVKLTARLEALHMGVTFLPSMLVGREILKMRFAMGSTLAMRKKDLQRMGGFEAVGSYLADDYQIGLRISKLGLKVQLSDYVIETILGATSFKEQWRRELRWAYCNRVSESAGYLGLLITFCTPLATLLFIATSFSGWSSWISGSIHAVAMDLWILGYHLDKGSGWPEMVVLAAGP